MRNSLRSRSKAVREGPGGRSVSPTRAPVTQQILAHFTIRSVSAAFARRDHPRRASASLAVALRRRDGARAGVGPRADLPIDGDELGVFGRALGGKRPLLAHALVELTAEERFLHTTVDDAPRQHAVFGAVS